MKAQNMHGVSIAIEPSGIISGITGEYVATLCDVCDGWEVSPRDDLFSIPIILEFSGSQLVQRVDLSAAEKVALVHRLDKRIALNNKQQLDYGISTYPKYTERVREGIINLLHGP